MKATVLVADAAQAVDGKIYALGLGWSHVGTPTPPHALIILLDVDWNETNHRFQLRAELVDSDMHEVTIQTSIGEQPVVLELSSRSVALRDCRGARRCASRLQRRLGRSIWWLVRATNGE